MSGATITIDLDAKCRHCGKGGATPSGRCLQCITKLIKKYGFPMTTWPTSGRV